MLLFGSLAVRKMPTDILPDVGIPSVNLIWTYAGLPAAEMASKVTSFSEISILNNVDDLKEVRSETLAGIAIVRIDFQSGVNLERALSQITAVSQTILRRMPSGMTPPLVVRNNVSSTPVLQLVLSSDALTEAQLYDYARLQMRSQIQSIPVALVPLSAVVQGSKGAQVATVAADSTLAWVPVLIGRNLGVTVEVLSGLAPGTTVVLSPNALLEAGARVQARAVGTS